MKYRRCATSLLVLLCSCAAPPTRQWLDGRTAATITAQVEPVVLSREDFPAGVNVRDYVELGLFDVNRSGEHRQYVALVLWSTVDRNAQQLTMQDQAFVSVTLWVDDQPVELRRVAPDIQASLVSESILRLPSPNAREMYYEIARPQLKSLAVAKHISVTPAGDVRGDRPYSLWRGNLASIANFIATLP